MKILIIGASHGIGEKTVAAALAAGHEVRAFARHPERLELEHRLLTKIAGDVLDADSVRKAVRGHDAVICTLGLPTRLAIGPPLAPPSYVLSRGIENCIAAMKAERVSRLLCVTAIGSGESVRQCTPLARLVLRSGLRWLFKEKDRQEALITASGLDWTIVRPTALTNGKSKGALVGENVRSGVLTNVSRADVAVSMIAMIGDAGTHNQKLVISYPARLGDSIRWTAGFFGLG